MRCRAFSASRTRRLLPAVVLLAGSGPNDPEGRIGRNKPLKDLACLARRGINKVTFAHHPKQVKANDNITAIVDEYVHPVAAVDRRQVLLAGHSLGGRRRLLAWHDGRIALRASAKLRVATAGSRVHAAGRCWQPAGPSADNAVALSPGHVFSRAVPAPSPATWSAVDGQARRAASAICSRSVLAAPSRAWADMPCRTAA